MNFPPVEYILIATVCVGVLMIIGSFLFNKIVISPKGLEFSKVQIEKIKTETRDMTIAAIFSKLKNTLEMVIDSSIRSGIRIGVLQTSELEQMEDAITSEQLEPLKTDFLDIFIRLMGKNKVDPLPNNESANIFEACIVNRYVSLVRNGLSISYRKNNWKEMTTTDYKEMVSRKIEVFITDYRRLVKTYYPESVLKLPILTVEGMLDDTGARDLRVDETTSLRERFELTIRSCFNGVSRAKDDVEMRIAKINEELKQEIAKIVTPDRISVDVMDNPNQ